MIVTATNPKTGARRPALPKGALRRSLPGLLTFVAMIAILIICGTIQPLIWS